MFGIQWMTRLFCIVLYCKHFLTKHVLHKLNKCKNISKCHNLKLSYFKWQIKSTNKLLKQLLLLLELYLVIITSTIISIKVVVVFMERLCLLDIDKSRIRIWKLQNDGQSTNTNTNLSIIIRSFKFFFLSSFN